MKGKDKHFLDKCSGASLTHVLTNAFTPSGTYKWIQWSKIVVRNSKQQLKRRTNEYSHMGKIGEKYLALHVLMIKTNII